MKAYGAKSAVRDSARDRLIADHIGMGRRIALRVARHIPSWMNEDDLISAAMIGLSEAADRYDPNRGEPFVAFAEKRIRGAVFDELRRGDVLPRRARWAARKVGATIRELEHRLGRRPEDHEIAAELSISVDEYRDNLEQLTHVAFVDLDSEKLGPAGISRDQSPADHAEKKQLVARIRHCLGKLQERDALILSLYYIEEFSYSEIGNVLSVSESRVCQLHARALVRLRTEFDTEPTAS